MNSTVGLHDLTYLFVNMGIRKRYNYQNVIRQLNMLLGSDSLIRSDSPQKLYKQRIEYVRNSLPSIGVTEADLDRFRIIHVTGSKGKGSTCAVVEAILRNLGYCTGFISSPHLVNVEERIRINGKPISNDRFADIFSEVYESAKAHSVKLTYIHCILLMALKAFLLEKVDAAIIEVGVGGRFDHTNFIRKPAVSVVTGVSLEHTDILGDTLEKIALNKAGIFKETCPAIVSSNMSVGLTQVFEDEANKVGCPLFVCPRFEDLSFEGPISDSPLFNQSPCDPPGVHFVKRLNLVLGLATVHLWLRQYAGETIVGTGLQPTLHFTVPKIQVQSALTAQWPGRWQKLERGDVTYFIDGAHTEDSVRVTAEWFSNESNLHTMKPITRVLIFNVIGTRDPKPMLRVIKSIVKPHFDLILFPNPHVGDLVVPLRKRSRDAVCLTAWNELHTSDGASPAPSAYRIPNVAAFVSWIHTLPTVTLEAIADFPTLSNKDASTSSCTNACCHVLVTGSLYLVGAALRALNEPID